MSAVIPGILENEWDELKKKIEIASTFTDAIHIDLLDGTFVANQSFLDPEPFAEYAKHITFELHLMVDDPLRYIKPFGEVGFRRFLAHIEMMPNQTDFVATAEQYGEVGLALDVHTPLHDIVVSYDDLDSLLIMTVKAGFSGQQFLPTPLHTVRSVREKHPLFLVEVDGGITRETLKQAYQAGARRFVATSAIFGASDPKQAFAELSEIFAREEEASVLSEETENS